MSTTQNTMTTSEREILRKELASDQIFLTDLEFEYYISKIDEGYTEDEAYTETLYYIDSPLLEENEKASQYITATNNFFYLGVQSISIEEAAMVMEWIEARYNASHFNVKITYNRYLIKLSKYILKNL